jgi:hypothetical protein
LRIVVIAACGIALAREPARLNLIADTEPPSAVQTPSPTPEAPFGLSWLSTKQQAADLVGSLDKPFPTQFGESYVVSSLPKGLTDTLYGVLSFGFDDRLVRIMAVGGGFENDHDGSRVKARYEELKKLMEGKYGPGESSSHTEDGFGGGGWALGLHGRKNWMYTVFKTPDVRIELSVFEENSRTNWRMIFEHVPGLMHLEQQRKKSDQEAL